MTGLRDTGKAAHTTPNGPLLVESCSLSWAGPHGPHEGCPGVPKSWRWSARFCWREFKNMRRFRLDRERPDHMTPWRWRLLEYRFAWALGKRVIRRV